MSDDVFPMSQTIDEQIIKEPTIHHTNSLDPTLKLPDHILHSIFSYLTSKDLINVCLVSKTWHQNSPSYFVFDFDQSFFFSKRFPIAIFEQMRNYYMEWVHSSLDTFKSCLRYAENRILRIQFNDHENVYNILKLMDENNFHEVYLRFEDIKYRLPYMFQSTCLTVLHLSHCAFDHQHIFEGEEKLYSLQELKLDCVRVKGKTLSMFISKCPNIRELILVNCSKLRSIVLPKLDRLNKLYVQFMSPFSLIVHLQVIAPNLQVFHFVYRAQREDPIDMDIRGCTMLRELYLDCMKFPYGLDHENFCSDFPRLETLLMGPCEADKTIKISSPSLRTLILFFTRMYEDSRTRVVFAPNLSTYECVGTTFKPFLNPSDAPNLLETKIGVAYNVEKINRAWTFINLRNRLKDFSNTIGLSLCIRDEEIMHHGYAEYVVYTMMNDEAKTPPSPGKVLPKKENGYFFLKHTKKKIKKTPRSPGKGDNSWRKLIGGAHTRPLHHIKHVLLDMNKLKFQYEYLIKYIMDCLFWMSHPDTLTILIRSGSVALANEFFDELKSRQEGNCSCETMDKCWGHFLKDFEVYVKSMTNEKDELEFVFKFTWHDSLV